jgi:hypothetical protein
MSKMLLQRHWRLPCPPFLALPPQVMRCNLGYCSTHDRYNNEALATKSSRQRLSHRLNQSGAVDIASHNAATVHCVVSGSTPSPGCKNCDTLQTTQCIDTSDATVFRCRGQQSLHTMTTFGTRRMHPTAAAHSTMNQEMAPIQRMDITNESM